MLKLIKIAITGGVASGKSAVCQFFKKLGAFIVDADAVVHEVLQTHTDLGRQIVQQFGSEVLEDGQISRRVLAEKVFKNEEKIQKLEQLIHPVVLRKIEELYEVVSRSKEYTSFVVEIPLLFEIGAEKFYDTIVTVLADERLAKERFQKAHYEHRMARQMAPKEKAMLSNYVIYNNGSLGDLEGEVIQLDRKIHKEFSRP